MNASHPDDSLPPLVLYGASGHASNVRDFAEWAGGTAPRLRVVAYIDDFRGDRDEWIDGVPIIGFERYRREFLHAPVCIAMGNGSARLQLAEKVRQAGGQLKTLIAGSVGIPPELPVGEGTSIGPLNFIGGTCRLGAQVLIMTQSLLGHHVIVGDGVTICSASAVGGHVVIEDEAFLGLGCVIVNGTPERPLVIGRGAVIYAGAVVTKSVPAGVTVMGNPARPLREFLKRRRGARS